MEIAQTPEPPYYAVIFTSFRMPGDSDYNLHAEQTLEIARQQPGFLGFESVREEIGISVSYWSDLESVRKWENHIDHIYVKSRAKDWYIKYKVRIAKVEKDYGK